MRPQRQRGERGDVILSGLLRIIGVLLVGGVLLFDGGAVVVNRVQLEEAARVAARAGAGALAGERSPYAAQQAVTQRLERQTGMTLEDLTIDRGWVTVTLGRPAAVLVLDRVGPLAAHAQGSASAIAGPPDR